MTCVVSCPSNLKVLTINGIKQCASNCPNEAPYLNGSICQSSCPKYYDVVDGITICVQTCKFVNKTTKYCMNDCPTFNYEIS